MGRIHPLPGLHRRDIRTRRCVMGRTALTVWPWIRESGCCFASRVTDRWCDWVYHWTVQKRCSSFCRRVMPVKNSIVPMTWWLTVAAFFFFLFFFSVFFFLCLFFFG